MHVNNVEQFTKNEKYTLRTYWSRMYDLTACETLIEVTEFAPKLNLPRCDFQFAY